MEQGCVPTAPQPADLHHLGEAWRKVCTSGAGGAREGRGVFFSPFSSRLGTEGMQACPQGVGNSRILKWSLEGRRTGEGKGSGSWSLPAEVREGDAGGGPG